MLVIWQNWEYDTASCHFSVFFAVLWKQDGLWWCSCSNELQITMGLIRVNRHLIWEGLSSTGGVSGLLCYTQITPNVTVFPIYSFTKLLNGRGKISNPGIFHKLVSLVSLTGTVCVIHKVHLERMAIVEDSFGVGQVVLEFQSLERDVVLRFPRHNVDRRLSRPIGYGEILYPFIRSWNIFIV